MNPVPVCQNAKNSIWTNIRDGLFAEILDFTIFVSSFFIKCVFIVNRHCDCVEGYADEFFFSFQHFNNFITQEPTIDQLFYMIINQSTWIFNMS